MSLKGLKKGKCDFLRKAGICSAPDPERCKELGNVDEEGWCLAIVIDTTPYEEQEAEAMAAMADEEARAQWEEEERDREEWEEEQRDQEGEPPY